MVMAQVVNLNLSSSYFYSPCRSHKQQRLHSTNNARFLCLFSHNNNNNNNNNNKQEQARKALEGALSGKKNEYYKWDKEIKRKEELGGGGGGGATGGGGWFGWSNDDHFWQEAKRACLTILAFLLMYLVLAKCSLLLAIIFNPLYLALWKVRNGIGFITSKVLEIITGNQSNFDGFSKKGDYQHASAKDNVKRKWGSD